MKDVGHKKNAPVGAFEVGVIWWLFHSLAA